MTDSTDDVDFGFDYPERKGNRMAIIRKKKPLPKRMVSEYILPTERSVPIGEIGGYTGLIFGKKKIGKTTLVQHFDDALNFMLEQGAKKLAVYQVSIRTWKDFKGYVTAVVKDTRFKTIIVDPVDIAYDLCFQYVCKNLGITHPADAGYGKGWEAIKREFATEINKLTNAGKGVIFISHMKDEEVELRSGRKFHRATNTLSGQGKSVVEGLVDFWCCYDYDGTTRYLTILGDDYVDAGHRLNEPPDAKFLYTNGEPIRRIPMGKTSKEAYDNFMKAFHNKLVKQEGGSQKQQNPVKKKGLVLKRS